MPVTLVKSRWSSGSLIFHEDGNLGDAVNLLSISQSEVTIGNASNDVDFKVFLGASGSYLLCDSGNGRLTLEGIELRMMDTEKLEFGDDGDIHASFTDGTGLSLVGNAAVESLLLGNDTYALNTTLKGTLTIGKDDTGHDVKLFGATSGAYLLWDESDNALEFVGAASIEVGTTGTPLALTAGTPIIDIYSTCASTNGSTSAEPFYLKSTMTGAGGVGGRARFHMYTNVALGGWANALKAYTEYGASGKTTGLGSALCAELALSAGTSSGTYAPLEAEIIAGSGASTGTATGFIYCNADGADEDTVDSNAYLFVLGDALDAASGKFVDTDITTHSAYAGIPVYIDGVGKKYIAIVSD